MVPFAVGREMLFNGEKGQLDQEAGLEVRGESRLCCWLVWPWAVLARSEVGMSPTALFMNSPCVISPAPECLLLSFLFKTSI